MNRIPIIFKEHGSGHNLGLKGYFTLNTSNVFLNIFKSNEILYDVYCQAEDKLQPILCSGARRS